MRNQVRKRIRFKIDEVEEYSKGLAWSADDQQQQHCVSVAVDSMHIHSILFLEISTGGNDSY